MSAWIAVALSADVEAGTTLGTAVDGAEIVVWRDAAGRIHAWEDRCPHRGMRMSFGFVRGDRIACLYHGWQYDGDGRCRAIPAHPDLEVPATIRIPRYPVAEASGLIWVRPVPDGTADVQAPPDEPATPVRSIHVDVPAADVAAALAADGLASLATAAVQPIGPARTAIHAVLPGAAEPAARAALARRLEALRRRLEGAEIAEVPA